MSSPSTLPFVKLHGAGNDYVYLDCFHHPEPPAPVALATAMADRHRGIGGDGLILLLPSERAAIRMRMFNADGSESEMCGNGLRCIAHLAVSRGHVPEGSITVETGRGILTVHLTRQGPRLSRVRVDMGPPILEPALIPVAIEHSSRQIVDLDAGVAGSAASWQEACGLDPRMTCVSMGNPHVVFYCRDVAAVPLAEEGPRIERHPLFPKRVNVHFVQVVAGDRVRMRTWERGSGITQACGTGASAVCVAGVLTGRTAGAITAELPGGVLELQWDPGGAVVLTGPAEEVFEGVWPLV